MNISLSIVFAIEGFFPRNAEGYEISSFDNFNQALPLITFLLSIFTSSFGMSKFLLSGPIPFLSKNSPLDGLISVPFFCLFWINIMFGIRIVCIECALFTSYRQQQYNASIGSWTTKSIDPGIPEEYRLIAYLFPCIFPFFINFLRVFCTYISKAPYQRQYSLIKYPQYLLACMFTPFMFEGYKPDSSKEVYSIRIWKRGTIINAFYIGCLPQCLLFGMEYYKGVPFWDFVGTTLKNSLIMEGNDALFKHKYGNTIFAAISFVFCFYLILIFFCSDKIIQKCGVNCRVFNVLCCHCPQSCLVYAKPDSPNSLQLLNQNTINNTLTEEPKERPTPKIEAYFYNKHGIGWMFGKPRIKDKPPDQHVRQYL